MPIVQTLLPEFDHEMADTRRLLEVVPAADVAWQPHPKSSSLASSPPILPRYPCGAGWCCSSRSWTSARPPTPRSPRCPSPPGRAARSVRSTRAAPHRSRLHVGRRNGRHLDPEEWGEKRFFFWLPRAVAVRGFVLSHMIHHRGQLSVYLRLRDVPLPSLYGPGRHPGMIGPMTVSLAGLTLHVADVDRSLASIAGYQVRTSCSTCQDGSLSFDLGQGRLGLLADRKRPFHIELEVPDLDAAAADLREGMEVDGPTQREWGERDALVRDPVATCWSSRRSDLHTVTEA